MYGFVCDPWKIIQNRLDPGQNRVAESLFTLGNEYMGLRGFFEEEYSGDTLKGVYVGGIYYPDKTRVGWWKNGYPDYFAKVPNSINWAGIRIRADGRDLDIARCTVLSFRRELDMRDGCLNRDMTVELPTGDRLRLYFQRFLSMDDRHVAVVTVQVTPLTRDMRVQAESYLDADVRNEDANYDEAFWTGEENTVSDDVTYLCARTRKTEFLLGAAQSVKVRLGGADLPREALSRDRYNAFAAEAAVPRDGTLTVEKYVAVYTSRDIPEAEIAARTTRLALQAAETGFEGLYQRHAAAMADKWERLDVRIDGDDLAQQGIRYNILQLFQTYCGYDPALNIGPKGYSGEKYGGVTYWDTEAFCFPFYLYNDGAIALNLLRYRYDQLDKAKENAAKLGLKGALYPMVTVNGEECHNEWEITFEEIHRNGAIAYAIYHYTRYTGDTGYLCDKGIEVLVELSRFWASRVSFSESRNQYVILGVTGPNEYENNVNNNWYTNTMAAWTLRYTLDTLGGLPQRAAALGVTDAEAASWQAIADGMYFPYDETRRVFEQQDLFRDKVLVSTDTLDSQERPIGQHWSWDRILRSCFIKQADVLQGIYFFPEACDLDTQRRNFLFYEPMTVHESSLSASIHSIIAARIGLWDKAYELYLRTARLDLEDINRDTEDGIHLTSMAGSWNAIVQGFAGLDTAGDTLTLSPYLPPQWEGYSFRIVFRGTALAVSVGREDVTVERLSGPAQAVAIRRPGQGEETHTV